MFFFLIKIILLSIVFGIIIGSFAQLREETRKIEHDKKGICYICGAKKEDLEKNCVNYIHHTSTDHDIWTYAEYIIGLKFMDPQELNAINSFVIEKIEKKFISWFPSTTAREKHPK